MTCEICNSTADRLRFGECDYCYNIGTAADPLEWNRLITGYKIPCIK